LPQYAVIGVLEALWIMAMHSAQDGALGRYSNEDIAATIEWAGDADELITILIETGWLDTDAIHRLIVHDWSSHCPNFIRGGLVRAGKKFAKVATTPEIVPIATTSKDIPLTPLVPNITKPNLTKPDPIDPKLEPYPDNEPANELTRQWLFYRRGSAASETMAKIRENFREIIRRQPTKYNELLTAVQNNARDRTEYFWQFKDRILGQPAKVIKTSTEVLKNMIDDPRKKELLETAFGKL